MISFPGSSYSEEPRGLRNQASRAALFSALLKKEWLGLDIFRLDFEWLGPEPRAGQFFLVRPRRTLVFLGRPLSAACRKTGEVGFLVGPRGRGIEEILDMETGEKAELIGPLGNSWHDFLPAAYQKSGSSEAGTVKKLALAGGGIGIAPLRTLAAELPAGSFDVYAGFRTGFGAAEKAALLGPLAETGKLLITADDGKGAPQGFITDFFDPGSYAAVYACGPASMLKAVKERCAGTGTPCFISMEKRMACGVGACLGCRVSAAGGNRRCCADGPIFPAGEVNLDDF